MERKIKLIAQNKKAFHDYYIEETYQAGIESVGTEVKSLRRHQCSLKDSFVKIENNQAYVFRTCRQKSGSPGALRGHAWAGCGAKPRKSNHL